MTDSFFIQPLKIKHFATLFFRKIFFSQKASSNFFLITLNLRLIISENNNWQNFLFEKKKYLREKQECLREKQECLREKQEFCEYFKISLLYQKFILRAQILHTY